MSHLQVNRKAPGILSALAVAPMYKKVGLVSARPATPGEEIRTTLADGTEETVNTAKEADWVVTNPLGEQYLISEQGFNARYEPIEESGRYIPKSYCRAMSNPFRTPIEILAPWGSPQRGDEWCLIAEMCDAKGNVDGEPYLIDLGAFIKTYRLVA